MFVILFVLFASNFLFFFGGDGSIVHNVLKRLNNVIVDEFRQGVISFLICYSMTSNSDVKYYYLNQLFVIFRSST